MCPNQKAFSIKKKCIMAQMEMYIWWPCPWRCHGIFRWLCMVLKEMFVWWYLSSKPQTWCWMLCMVDPQTWTNISMVDLKSRAPHIAMYGGTYHGDVNYATMGPTHQGVSCDQPFQNKRYKKAKWAIIHFNNHVIFIPLWANVLCHCVGIQVSFPSMGGPIHDFIIV